MRVISGVNKGQRLISPKGKNTRPTEDRVKESVFNILMPIEEDSIVLDIFSGSGQIGIEFLSRGASKAVFVDSSRESVSVINENLDRTRLKDNALVIKNNFANALKYCKNNNIIFDYIYMDPPFKEVKLFTNTIEKISTYSILKDNGLLIVEHDCSLKLNDMFNFKLIDHRGYGNVDISMFKIDKR